MFQRQFQGDLCIESQYRPSVGLYVPYFIESRVEAVNTFNVVKKNKVVIFAHPVIFFVDVAYLGLEQEPDLVSTGFWHP